MGRLRGRRSRWEARKAVKVRTGIPVITWQNAVQLNQGVTGLIEGTISEPDPEETEK